MIRVDVVAMPRKSFWPHVIIFALVLLAMGLQRACNGPETVKKRRQGGNARAQATMSNGETPLA